MTLRTIFASVKTALITGSKAFVTALLDASIGNVIRAAIFVGVSIYIAYILIAHLRARRKNYEEKKDETPVDRSLCLNFEEPNQFERLNPLIKCDKTLRKAMNKQRKKYANNPKVQAAAEKFRKTRTPEYRKREKEDLDHLTERVHQLLFPGGKIFDETDPIKRPSDVANAMDEFHEYMKKWNKDQELRDEEDDNFTLRRIWDSPAY